MPLPGGILAARNCIAAAAFAITVIFQAVVADSATNNPQVICSRTCVTENCKTAGIRYGKYCGLGWSGCPGEKPCDDLDACCQIHDDCVGNKGMVHVQCHEELKTCITKVRNCGKAGFSKDCPYETVIPIMIKGMDVAILLSELSNTNNEEYAEGSED